jgi:hypothetical protein
MEENKTTWKGRIWKSLNVLQVKQVHIHKSY